MADYDLSLRAEADLLQILLEGYERFGPDQADGYVAEMEDVFRLIVSHPSMGRPARELGKGVRRHEHNSHVIFYAPTRAGILVLRIVHGKSVRHLRL